jgi:hypothetical protein
LLDTMTRTSSCRSVEIGEFTGIILLKDQPMRAE